MTSKGIQSDMSKQLFKALDKIDKLEQKLDKAYDVIDELKKDFSIKEKNYQKTISELRTENKELKNTIEKLENENKDLKSEILRLRVNNKKDSSNSSKPSSTNGYKNVITNRRNKSNNKPGKPKGSHSTNLSKEKFEKFCNSGNVEYKTICINKNSKNKNKKFIVVKELDIKIIKQVTEYRYYPNEDGSYDIPPRHNRVFVYGTDLKSICCALNNDIYNSTDGIVRFISSITNDGINLSKSTIIRWNNELANNFNPQINHIESSLIESYYLNCDDSTLKISGQGYNDLCVCNDKYTRLWISEKKDRESWKKLTVLSNYKGIIVKDGTDVFNGLGLFLSQCASHILRYIKGIYDFIDHNGAKKMDIFLKKCIHNRKEKIKNGILAYTEEELKRLYDEYATILKEWKKEWMKSSSDKNPVYNDERKLLSRFEDENEKEQILYFLKDFNVPTTNSQAEVDQRHAKIKQKIGKFRSVNGATDYAIIRSCINTYKKNNVNVIKAIKLAFLGEPIII
jgi:FtsZ-binding cell division protein ZapB